MNRIGLSPLLVLVATAMLTACAGGPTNAELRPVEPGTRVNVIVTLPEVQAPNALDTGEAVGRGAGSMAAQGAALGVYASAECGPLFFICMPFSVVGLAAGGAVVGSAVGASIALPAEKADQLEKIVSDYLATEDIALKLREEFTRQQDGRWTIVDDAGDVSITLGVESLAFEQAGGDQLLLILTSNLIVRYGPEDQDLTKRLLLEARTDSHHIDHWIADDGAVTRSGLAEVFAENSRQVIAVLSQPIRRLVREISSNPNPKSRNPRQRVTG